MLQKLLWRCPLCETDDAIRHTRRLLIADRVICCQCQACWQLRRIAGDTFYLKLVENPAGLGAFKVGKEHPITTWYDAMKTGIQLQPIEDLGFQMKDGERLFVVSKRVELVAEETDERFFVAPKGELLPIAKNEIEGRPVGPGRLLLTSHRLVWQAMDEPDRKFLRVVSIPLKEINFASTFFGLVLNVGFQLYMIYVPSESMLKWLTYLDLVAKHIGHQIKISNY